MKQVLLIFFSSLLALSGCKSPDDENKEVSSQKGDCTLTFIVWQKDAYFEEGGRNRNYLPVHSSTSLAMNCKDGEQITKSHPNHGAVPGEKDASGRLLLDETYRDTFELSKPAATAFLKKYEDTLCEGVTEFLSLERLQDGVNNTIYSDDFRNKMKKAFGEELKKRGHQKASDMVLAIVVSDKYEQQMEAVFNEVRDLKMWAKLFTQSWLHALKTGLKLESQKYHVCNNDAKQSHMLWLNLKRGLPLEQFQLSDDTCKGPILFFAPDNTDN